MTKANLKKHVDHWMSEILLQAHDDSFMWSFTTCWEVVIDPPCYKPKDFTEDEIKWVKKYIRKNWSVYKNRFNRMRKNSFRMN